MGILLGVLLKGAGLQPKQVLGNDTKRVMRNKSGREIEHQALRVLPGIATLVSFATPFLVSHGCWESTFLVGVSPPPYYFED